MAYDNLVSRTDAGALIPEDVQREVMQRVAEDSAALGMFRQRTLSRAQQRIPVKSVLPTAYFVNGDTGLKQTTEVNWDNVYLNVEEIATIVPVPEAVLMDVDYDLWDEVEPDLREAIGRALDAAIFFGTNKPASWPTALVASAVAAGNVIARGTNNAAAGGIAADLSDLFGTVENDGYDVSGLIAARSVKGKLRNARDADGRKHDEVGPNEAYSVPISYPMRGLWPTGLSAAEMIGGDFSQGIIGVRQELETKVLDQAVITDNSGDIIYNLPQQDMIALRVVARFAFAVPNPTNWDQPNEANRYPFGVLRSPAA
mgnify:CR=1 FL=1